jgi:hypothetical protein
VGVAVVYVVATLALTGMQPYTEISPVSGFPSAFYAIGLPWAGQVSAIGEIVTLPIVVLISIMAQPRLQYALAQDGLAPSWLAATDNAGNLWLGTLFAGSLMVLIASFVPFQKLNDAISCAVLAALCLTDTSLVLLWHSSRTGADVRWSDDNDDGIVYDNHHAFQAVHDDDDVDGAAAADRRPPIVGRGPWMAEGLMVAFHLGAFIASASATLLVNTIPGALAVALGCACMAMSVYGIVAHCPRHRIFGGGGTGMASLKDDAFHDNKDPCYSGGEGGGFGDESDDYFSVWTPYVPCLGILVNWYLIAQLDVAGILGLVLFLAVASLYYYFAVAARRRNSRPSRKRATSAGGDGVR